MNQPTQLKLNQGQQAAADGFFAFLLSDEKELIISGPGGHGKTFLMGYLIDEVMKRYFEMCKMMNITVQYTDVVMTATTNKAAEAVGIATGRPAQTIHSFLSLKVSNDFSTGKTRLEKTNRWKVHQNMIIFIDEYSIIDSYLKTYIDEGTCNCKIVYVGDHCQLGPVMEKVSAISKDKIPFYELKEPMRNAGQPALIAICQQLRETVETGIFKPIQIVPGVIDYLEDEDMESLLTQTFIKTHHDSRVLCYSNERVNAYNDHIRLMRQLPDEYLVGDILINNSGIQLPNCVFSAEEEVEIIEMSTDIDYLELPEGGRLEIRLSTLQGGRGHAYKDVMIPVDRKHFNELVKYYKSRKNWAAFYKLKNNIPDLRPRDANTIHKSQGSTYGTAFIDLSDLSRCPNPNLAARLMYVAFSRAKHGIFLYGDLATKYGGFL